MLGDSTCVNLKNLTCWVLLFAGLPCQRSDHQDQTSAPRIDLQTWVLRLRWLHGSSKQLSHRKDVMSCFFKRGLSSGINSLDKSESLMVYLENVFPLTSTNTSPDVRLGKMMGRSGRQKVGTNGLVSWAITPWTPWLTFVNCFIVNGIQAQLTC